MSIKATIEYAKRLINTPYAVWTEGCPLGPGPPFWNGDDVPPSVDDVMEKGTNCVGLINLLSMAVGHETHSNWFKHFEDRGALEAYKPDQIYVPGTMLLREFKDEDGQGHVAMIVSDDELIHSYMNVDAITSFGDMIRNTNRAKLSLGPGVTIEKIEISHSWFEDGTYTHVCLPEHWLK